MMKTMLGLAPCAWATPPNPASASEPAVPWTNRRRLKL
jgi:hypothetical protein